MLLSGCYERFVFGHQVADDDEQQPALTRAFTHAAHKGVVKCAAAAGRYAATGGADDLIHLYDLKGDKDLGFLMSPGEGAVTALAFYTPAGAYSPTHLLTGAADGGLSVWQAGGEWNCLKTMRGHRKEVTGLAVHPSGLLALTVSRDGFLKMWDLVKGRCTYTSRLEAEADAVAFSGEDGGSRYALLCGARVTLHSVGGEHGAVAALDHPRRVLCMAWAPGKRIVTGTEDGALRLWDAQAGVELLCISRAHASRVRALALVPPASAGGRLLVATASSDGSLKLWDLSKAAADTLPGGSGGACLAEAQTRARLTCLVAADAPGVMARELQQQGAARQAGAHAAAAAAKQERTAAAVGGGQKRKQVAAAKGKPQRQQRAGAGGAQQQQPAAKRPKQSRGASQQQQPHAEQQQVQQQREAGGGNKGGKVGGKHAKGAPPAAAAAATAGDGVVVHDGVVEFLDSPDAAKKAQKKAREVAAKRHHATQRGKRFRSVPGQGSGDGGRPPR